ncbi:serpin family protein [Paenibacillus harenae]|uniref:serpin family protein n=1 Tax=Paenibacillus harenae TaxID=306543 RepID=UPI0003FF3D36|nr:serpin family protein [Paenibacillus harenae]
MNMATTPAPTTLTYTTNDVNERMVQANNKFGLMLYQELLKSEKRDGNKVISPLSIQNALVMTYNGADAETKKAMEDVLRINGLTLQDINMGNEVLNYVLEHADPSVVLSIANSLWAKEGKEFHKTFLDNNRTYYDAEVTSLDLTAPGTPDQINKWVKEKTNGKIEKIVEGPIDPLTVLFLINAIYFNGEWARPFQENATTDGEFAIPDGSTIQVPMMSQSGEFEYKAGEGYQAVRMPYGKGTIRMVVYLPTVDSPGLGKMMSVLLSDPDQLTKGFHLEDGQLRVPRFKSEYSVSLNDALKALGMEIAFDPKRANFGNMAPIPPNLYISNVQHKTFIEVNEQGTEAAAVTSVEVKAESATQSFTMDVNRPFFFTIEDGSTGTMLFMGCIENPGQE